MLHKDATISNPKLTVVSCTSYIVNKVVKEQSNLYKKGQSREPENVLFMSSCPLYTG
jgi:hypothetical protein